MSAAFLSKNRFSSLAPTGGEGRGEGAGHGNPSCVRVSTAHPLPLSFVSIRVHSWFTP